MTTQDDQNRTNQIWNFVLEHEEYFCDPPPTGLGFPRPGMIPDHYLKRPQEWPLDRIRVLRLKRERQLREGTADRTVSAGMAPETRQLLDRIRRLALDGWSPQAIAAELDLTEGGVRNVLALGQDVYAAGGHATAQLPEVDSFLKSWGKPHLPGSANGNGRHDHQERGGAR